VVIPDKSAEPRNTTASRVDRAMNTRPRCDRELVLTSGTGARKDAAKARELYALGCELDHAGACSAAARLTDEEVERKVLEEKSCRLGDGGACFTLGSGALHDDRPRDAYRYFKAACDSGAEVMGAQGCKLAEQLAEKGWAEP
jgi:TPR repeat protein